MMEATGIAVTVTLFVKAEEAEQARDIAAGKLNEWFIEPPTQPPFPVGTLLWYTFRQPVVPQPVEDDGYLALVLGNPVALLENEPPMKAGWTADLRQ